jgi:hypothetical protein
MKQFVNIAISLILLQTASSCTESEIPEQHATPAARETMHECLNSFEFERFGNGEAFVILEELKNAEDLFVSNNLLKSRDREGYVAMLKQFDTPGTFPCDSATAKNITRKESALHDIGLLPSYYHCASLIAENDFKEYSEQITKLKSSTELSTEAVIKLIQSIPESEQEEITLKTPALVLVWSELSRANTIAE